MRCCDYTSRRSQSSNVSRLACLAHVLTPVVAHAEATDEAVGGMEVNPEEHADALLRAMTEESSRANQKKVAREETVGSDGAGEDVEACQGATRVSAIEKKTSENEACGDGLSYLMGMLGGKEIAEEEDVVKAELKLSQPDSLFDLLETSERIGGLLKCKSFTEGIADERKRVRMVQLGADLTKAVRNCLDNNLHLKRAMEAWDHQRSQRIREILDSMDLQPMPIADIPVPTIEGMQSKQKEVTS